MMMRQFYSALAVCLIVCACATHTEKSAQKKPLVVRSAWAKAFHDPLVDNLVIQILNQNIDIKIAQKRVDEAYALYRANWARQLPSFETRGSASRGNASFGAVKPQAIAQGGFYTDWELDIFGANRAAARAARSRMRATIATQDDIRNSITYDMVRAIVEWRQGNHMLREATQLVEAQSDQVSILESRVKAGLTDATYLQRAKAQRDQTSVQIPLAQSMIDRAQYRIERLLGRDAGSMSVYLKDFSNRKITVPAPYETLRVRIDTIRRRPDIRAKRAQLEAAAFDLAQAEADLWPKLSVSQFFGAQETSRGLEPFTAGNPIWSAANSITMPIFNFGQLRNRIKASDARAKTAVLEYENAVLMALEEARSAFSDYMNGVEQIKKQDASLRHRRDAVALAKERFDRGLTDMVDLTTAQSELDSAAIALINAEASTAIAYARLMRAMGQ